MRNYTDGIAFIREPMVDGNQRREIAICRTTAGDRNDVYPQLFGFEISFLDFLPAVLRQIAITLVAISM